MKSFFNNPWIVTIIGGIVVSVVVTLITTGAIQNPFDSSPVEQIVITNPNSFIITEPLALSADIYPEKAKDKTIRWEVVEGLHTTAAGANILNGKLSATGLGQIEVMAISNENEQVFATTIISVIKESVVDIINTNAKTDSYIKASLTEAFSTNSLTSSQWKIKDSTDNNGQVNNASIISGRTAYTGLYSVFLYTPQGVTSPAQTAHLFTNATIEESDTVTLSFWARGYNTWMGSFDDNSYTRIAIMISDDNGANWTTVWTSGVLGTTWARIEQTIDTRALSGPSREMLIAIACISNDSIASAGVHIDDIAYIINGYCPSFTAGESLVLSSDVVPANATFQEVTYEIVSSGTTASGASMSGNILTANAPGYIRIRPIADGVIGKEFVVIVVGTPINLPQQQRGRE